MVDSAGCSCNSLSIWDIAFARSSGITAPSHGGYMLCADPSVLLVDISLVWSNVVKNKSKIVRECMGGVLTNLAKERRLVGHKSTIHIVNGHNTPKPKPIRFGTLVNTIRPTYRHNGQERFL